MNRIKTTSVISIAGLLCAGLLTSAVQAANAPEWLGGKLTKPLSETRIGITVLYPGSNAYQAKYAETAVSYAKELGIDATVMDPQGDPAVQFNQIEDMVSQNLDVIVLWPTSQNALIPAVRQAARAGIPVITSNSPIGEAGRRYIKAHTGPDDCAQAEQAAEMLGDSLNGKGNIVVVEGTPGYSVSILRKNCFLDKIEDAYPNVNILASQSADWNREKAQTVMDIVLWPTSQNALIPAVRQAARAGIPVITSNSPIGEAGRRYIKAHTGPDDCAQAEQAAEMLGDSLNGKGNIVVVEGTPGYSVSILRKNCFLDKIEDAYPNVNILASQSADWNREKAQTVMETFLTKFGNDIDGVYAFDDGMGLGVISALQAKGKKPGDVKVVTCNLFGEGWDAIKTGWETGSNKQSAEDDAILAIQTAVKIAHGIDVPTLAQIETPKIQANNVNQFERPSW